MDSRESYPPLPYPLPDPPAPPARPESYAEAPGYFTDVFLIEHDPDKLIREFDLPPALAKAICDPFDYAMGLRDGTVLFFSEAGWRPGSAWVSLDMKTEDYYFDNQMRNRTMPIPFKRGIDVRISEIAWVADAPFGS